MSRRPPPPDETAPPDQGDAASDYEVGYGRPPVATRFKSGQSGNPKGRPKASKNLSTLAREKLQAKVPVREAGRERRMSKAEIGVTKMINRFAETGDPKLFAIFMKQLEGVSGGSGAVGIPMTSAEEQESHADILAWFLEQNRNSAGEGGGS